VTSRRYHGGRRLVTPRCSDTRSGWSSCVCAIDWVSIEQSCLDIDDPARTNAWRFPDAPFVLTQQGSGSSSGGRAASAARPPRSLPAQEDVQPSASQQHPVPAPQPSSPRPYATDPLVGSDQAGRAGSSWPYNPGAAAENLYQSGGFGAPVFDAEGSFAGPDHGFGIPGLGGDPFMDAPESTGDGALMSGGPNVRHLELPLGGHLTTVLPTPHAGTAVLPVSVQPSQC